QFPDISWPGIILEQEERLGRNLAVRHAKAPAEGIEKNAHQVRKVRGAGPQRRHLKRDHLQTEIEILSKLSLPNPLLEGCIGGRQDSHVNPNVSGPAHPHELPLLKYPQQLDLSLQSHLPDLVQKNGSALRHLELSVSAFHCASEGSPFVAEELALNQIGRDGGAIDGQNGSVAARAVE